MLGRTRMEVRNVSIPMAAHLPPIRMRNDDSVIEIPLFILVSWRAMIKRLQLPSLWLETSTSSKFAHKAGLKCSNPMP